VPQRGFIFICQSIYYWALASVRTKS